jgi:hypothetical protein
MKIVGFIVFSAVDEYLGETDGDPDAAAIALQKAGYTVARLPERLRPRISIPGDDFMEAMIDAGVITDEENILFTRGRYDPAVPLPERMDGVLRTIDREMEGIVEPFGGWVEACGFEPHDYVPEFDSLFVMPNRPETR